MSDNPSVAQTLAERLHASQIDKAGQPYIGHLRRVVAHLLRRHPDAPPHEVEAAWLHDALEDTGATRTSLLAAGVSPAAVEIVEAVTRPHGVPYLEWIGAMAVKGNVGVLRVKLADNEDNRNPARIAALPGAARMVETRYEPARLLLDAALRRAEVASS